jgi:hypothetical protein
MRTKAWLCCGLLLVSGGFITLSLTRGQEASSATGPAATKSGAQSSSTPQDGANQPSRDLTKLPRLQQQIYLSARRGADWLRRANRADGRFVYGYLPDLKAHLEGDHYLRQAGAAYALARMARFFQEDDFAAVARQAILTLLLDTATDSSDPRARHTTLPSAVVNRLASAGLLVLAINELPSPGEDLLEQSEQLCNFVRKQQARDGSLRSSDAEAPPEADLEGVSSYPGEALAGLMRSQRHRPAEWKTDVVRKALPYYREWWRAHKTMTLVPWQTAAFTEAFLMTKEEAFAEFVQEMNDWLCGLQYSQLDPRHPLWSGGFMEWADGQPLPRAPQVHSGTYAESLVEASRVARQAGDVTRFQRYRESVERCLQFLTTLQYTDANTQHFTDWYRPVLLGAFHASHQDGTLRIDYTQEAACAMVQYLTYLGEW